MPTKKTSYTIIEAARWLGISRQAVHGAITAGKLKAKRRNVVKKVWLIPAAELKTYQVSLSHQQRAKR